MRPIYEPSEHIPTTTVPETVMDAALAADAGYPLDGLTARDVADLVREWIPAESDRLKARRRIALDMEMRTYQVGYPRAARRTATTQKASA